MKKIIDLFKYYWQQRIFKACTMFALIDFYLLIFHYAVYTKFLSQLAEPLAQNPTVIASIAGIIGGVLMWIKK
jgi:hypothetical protein